MADIKPQSYRDTRPAEYFEPFHRRSRTREPNWVYEMVRMITTVISILVYRVWGIGTGNVPASGPVILAPNHFSQMDHFFTGTYLRRKIRFMAKSQLFGPPVLTQIFTHGGVFPIRRGHHDEEAFVTANTILRRGGCVLVYAEGGRSRTGGLGKPKHGVGRLALESGAPVVPVAIHGSAAVRAWRRFRFPKVTIQFGEALAFDRVEAPTREQSEAAAETIFEPVRQMYEALDARGRRGVLRALRAERRRESPGTA